MRFKGLGLGVWGLGLRALRSQQSESEHQQDRGPERIAHREGGRRTEGKRFNMVSQHSTSARESSSVQADERLAFGNAGLGKPVARPAAVARRRSPNIERLFQNSRGGCLIRIRVVNWNSMDLKWLGILLVPGRTCWYKMKSRWYKIKGLVAARSLKSRKFDFPKLKICPERYKTRQEEPTFCSHRELFG